MKTLESARHAFENHSTLVVRTPMISTNEKRQDVDQEFFRDRFCRCFDVPADEFLDRLVERAMSRRARLMLPLATALHPGYLQADHDFADDLGACRSYSELQRSTLNISRYYTEWQFLRWKLGVRMSARRMMKLAAKIYGFENRLPGSSAAALQAAISDGDSMGLNRKRS